MANKDELIKMLEKRYVDDRIKDLVERPEEVIKLDGKFLFRLANIDLNEKQKLFFNSTNRHIAYGGSRGGGKSFAMRIKFITLAISYPNLHLLLLRRTLPELRENHLIPMQEFLNNFATYKEVEKSFIFPNGSRIKLGYCDSESDVFQFQGQEYHVVGLEEATHFSESQKVFLTTCNRGVRTDFKPRMYYTSNPGGVGHNWFKRLFIDREYRNKEKEENYSFIPAQVFDNTALMDNNSEYVEILENLPDDLKKAHLYGDWNVFAGQMFSEFRMDKHVIKPFEIPISWKRFRSIDWGYNDNTAVYWYAVYDKHIYVYRELVINRTLASEVAKLIKEMSENEDISYTVASPDMWQKRGGDYVHGESIAETFAKNGVPCIKADHNRISGWQRMHEFLADAPDQKPYLQFFENCKKIIKDLPQLCYDESKPEDAATEPHDITDTNDSIRYGIMSRPKPNAETILGYKEGGQYLKAELKMKGFKKHQISKLTNKGKIKLIGR
jgi:phage terminase large subunit